MNVVNVAEGVSELDTIEIFDDGIVGMDFLVGWYMSL